MRSQSSGFSKYGGPVENDKTRLPAAEHPFWWETELLTISTVCWESPVSSHPIVLLWLSVILSSITSWITVNVTFAASILKARKRSSYVCVVWALRSKRSLVKEQEEIHVHPNTEDEHLWLHPTGTCYCKGKESRHSLVFWRLEHAYLLGLPYVLFTNLRSKRCSSYEVWTDCQPKSFCRAHRASVMS